MNFLPSKSRFKNYHEIIKENFLKKYICDLDPFLTLGYVEDIKVFVQPSNAVP